MRKLDLIIDCGSHSVKLYKRDEQIEQLAVQTWELLENQNPAEDIEKHLQSLIKPWISAELPESEYSIKAIGTEAMRRHPILAQEIDRVSKLMGINYSTISQYEEAILLRKAAIASHIPAQLDIINAGGGSIQMLIGSEEKPVMFPFGISDLNVRFHLTDVPEKRRIRECIDWIVSQFPSALGQFTYTGGEKQYLTHFGIPLPGGYCSKQDFLRLAEELSRLSFEELEARSPFDPKWMRGAIASNCIVLAALERSKTDVFMPTDLNIAHGVLVHV